MISDIALPSPLLHAPLKVKVKVKVKRAHLLFKLVEQTINQIPLPLLYLHRSSFPHPHPPHPANIIQLFVLVQIEIQCV
jgi:hypothetical protein